MCGIAGVFSERSITPPAGLVAAILNDQRTRGPDFESMVSISSVRAHIELGHNHLIVIDKSETAKQPMYDSDRRNCLVFNGEIYNYLELKRELETRGHVFVTQSDTEILLTAFKEWDVDCADKFVGMFAFAIYDRRDEKLYLYRDRFGVKPLYYYLAEGILCFASTCRVIADTFKLSPNLDYVARGIHYLIYDDDYGSSAYEGIRSLQPGCYMVIEVGEHRSIKHHTVRYYNLTDHVQLRTDKLERMAVADIVELLNETLSAAVRFRMRADVPIGISLSGGIDSSLLASYMEENGNQIHAITYCDSDDSKSERRLVMEQSRKLGYNVRYVTTNISEIELAFDETIKAQDAPFAGGSIIAQYLLYKAASEEGLIVMIGGQGGDEVFMGYRKYLYFRLMRSIKLREYRNACEQLIGLSYHLLAQLNNLSELIDNSYRYMFDGGEKTRLTLPQPRNVRLKYDPNQQLRQRQALDISNTSLSTLLRYEDCNSMANSIESRQPYLDQSVVELGLAIPDALKLKNGYGKWILRELSKGRILDEIRMARWKNGFDVGQSAWIKNGLGRKIRNDIHERKKYIGQHCDPRMNIDEYFSDRNLCGRLSAWTEAVSLIWMGNALSRRSC